MELANLLAKGAVNLYSLYRSQQASGGQVTHAGVPKIGVGFGPGQQDWSDAQLCAAELTYKLSSAIMADDEFSRRTSYPAGNWRDPGSGSHVPLAIGCVPEGFDRRKAKIVCRAQIDRGDDATAEEDVRREVFARYWAYFPETDTDGAMAKEHSTRLEALEAFGAIPSDGPIAKLFNQGHGIRLFSPFHPNESHFDVQFRSQRRQSICKVILDTRYEQSISREEEEPMIAIDRLSIEFPELFHRLMSDIYSQVPKGLPSATPRPVESIGHIKDLLPRFEMFIDKYRYGGWRADYSINEDITNAVDAEGFSAHVPLSLLADRLKRCILLTSIGLESKMTPLFRCDNGLAGWSRCPLCPPSSMCYDSVLCSRMISCGAGLWFTLRGQYTLEATGRIVKNYTPETIYETLTGYAPNVYDYDPTTQAFYDFPPKERDRMDDDGVIWQKLHVSKGTSSFFAVVFYQPSADDSGVGSFYRRREEFEDRQAKRAVSRSSLDPRRSTAEEPKNSPTIRHNGVVGKQQAGQAITTNGRQRASVEEKREPEPVQSLEQRVDAQAAHAGKSFYADFADDAPPKQPAVQRHPPAQKPPVQKQSIGYHPASFYESFSDSDSAEFHSQINGDEEAWVSASSLLQPKITQSNGMTKLVQPDSDDDEFVVMKNSPPANEPVPLIRNAPTANPYKRTPNPGFVQPQRQAQPAPQGRLPPLGPNAPTVNKSSSFTSVMQAINKDEK